jgi:hypothetical protein
MNEKERNSLTERRKRVRACRRRLRLRQPVQPGVRREQRGAEHGAVQPGAELRRVLRDQVRGPARVAVVPPGEPLHPGDGHQLLPAQLRAALRRRRLVQPAPPPLRPRHAHVPPHRRVPRRHRPRHLPPVRQGSASLPSPVVSWPLPAVGDGCQCQPAQAQQHPASRVLASKRHAPWLAHRCVGAVSSCLQQAERFLALPTRLLRLRPLLLALATRCSAAVACGEKGRDALFLVTRSVPSVTGSRTAARPGRRTTTNARAASSIVTVPSGGRWLGWFRCRSTSIWRHGPARLRRFMASERARSGSSRGTEAGRTPAGW